MTSRPPPVPPANRSPKGPGDQTEPPASSEEGADQAPENLKEQGRQGNIKQNTTHQGYQQDR
jgi:hypothetical protein